MTSSYMKQRMVETVVPPYCTAYTTLNEHIVQKLLAADTESDEATVRTLVNSLLCAAKNVHDELRRATEASEQLRNTIDEQITQLVLSISNQEERVRQSQQAANQANINIQHAQHQVTVAEAAVRNSQHSLNVANHAVHEAHEAAKKARVCGVGRRKKRFLGFIRDLNPVKIFRNAIGKPLCSVINSGGIENAKERRALAEQNLHQTHQRLHTHQQNLAAQQTQYNRAQGQLNAANTQLHTITSALNEQRAKQSLVASLTKQFKDVEVHLNNVLGSSTVLQDEMTQLIDFELVIEPLNSIYHEMLNSNIMESFGFEISAETSRQINTNLKKLTEILPKRPLNAMMTTDTKTGNGCSLSSISQQCSGLLTVNQSQDHFNLEPITNPPPIDHQLGNKIPLYRYHANGAHFYTTSEDEIGTTTPGSVGRHGYVAEGIAFYILQTAMPGTVPWYRYGNGAYSRFYMSNWQEIGTNTPGAVSNRMKMKGIIGYVYSTQQTGTCPLYRYVQIHNSQHFYTVHPCEIGTTTSGTVVRHNYKFEGIAAYVFTSFPCPHYTAAC